MNTPKYVRLRTGLVGRYDIRSGWGISGLDVKPMPDEDKQPNAFAYVSGELKAGRLEGASKAEYEEVHEDLVDLSDYDSDHPIQERIVREAAAARHNAIRQSRDSGDAEDVADADEKRRKAVLKEQKAKDKKSKKKAAAEDDTATTEGGDSERDRYADLLKADLVAEADSREVDSSGTADDIRTRLREADEAAAQS